MKPTDREKFAQLVTAALGYYRQDATPFVLDVWWQACQSFDLEQVAKALTAHAMDPDRGRFCPMVADMVRQLSGTTTDRAALAWGKALEAAARVGAYSDVVFDDPAVHAAIEDMGGWVKFCRTETKELGYLQHRFCESHRAYTGRGKFDYPRILTGDRSPDEVFAKRGLKPPKPVVIGDVERARLVYRGGAEAGRAGFVAVDVALLAASRAPARLGDEVTA